jgi:hypothetical protein
MAGSSLERECGCDFDALLSVREAITDLKQLDPHAL